MIELSNRHCLNFLREHKCLKILPFEQNLRISRKSIQTMARITGGDLKYNLGGNLDVISTRGPSKTLVGGDKRFTNIEIRLVRYNVRKSLRDIFIFEKGSYKNIKIDNKESFLFREKIWMMGQCRRLFRIILQHEHEKEGSSTTSSKG